jgi:hypothetical protein
MPAQRQHPGRLESGRPAADDEDVTRDGVPALDRRLLGLVAGRRLGVVRDDRIAHVAHGRVLVGQRAGPDPLGRPGPDLRDEVRLRDLRSRHLDEIAHAVVERLLSERRIDDAPLQHDRHGDGTADLRAEPPVEAGLRVQIRSRCPDREPRAPDGHQVVDAPGDGRGHRRPLLRCDPRPRRQLVAAQPQPEHPLVTEPRPDGGQHLAQQPHPVGAVAVGAAVGEPGEELTQDRVLSGLDLDTVETRAGGQRRGLAEAGDERVDLGLPDLHRHFPRDGVGHPRRRPQRLLPAGRAALPARVPEPGEHERAVRTAGMRDRCPPPDGVGGERRALVGPVGRVHARDLGDDDAGTSRRPPRVVGDVAVGDLPASREVRLVQPEEHPARRRPSTQDDRLRQPGHAAVRIRGIRPGLRRH